MESRYTTNKTSYGKTKGESMNYRLIVAIAAIAGKKRVSEIVAESHPIQGTPLIAVWVDAWTTLIDYPQ